MDEIAQTCFLTRCFFDSSSPDGNHIKAEWWVFEYALLYCLSSLFFLREATIDWFNSLAEYILFFTCMDAVNKTDMNEQQFSKITQRLHPNPLSVYCGYFIRGCGGYGPPLLEV